MIDQPTGRSPRLLIISQHDFRSARKANVHFIVESLVRDDYDVQWFSTGFSLLSYVRGDPRLGGGLAKNQVERVSGVDCYLWCTLLHPFRLPFLDRLPGGTALFGMYAQRRPRVLSEWIKAADLVLIESGLGIIHLDQIHKSRPELPVIYLASDDLATIGTSQYLIDRLAQSKGQLDGIRVPSELLRPAMPPGVPVAHVPHGLALPSPDEIGPNPYPKPGNVVSVGSMLFDPGAVLAAAKAFPDLTFHLIGTGWRHASHDNIRVYPEMPFAETLPYLYHADVGMAAYSGAEAPFYLSDTSMKLIQFDALGVPAVCPHFAVGRYSERRFGYTVGRAEEVVDAVHRALAAAPFDPSKTLTWGEVAERIVALG